MAAAAAAAAIVATIMDTTPMDAVFAALAVPVSIAALGVLLVILGNGVAGSGSGSLTAAIVNAAPSLGHVIAHEVYPVAAV